MHQMTYKKHFFKGPSRLVVAPRLEAALQLQRLRSGNKSSVSLAYVNVLIADIFLRGSRNCQLN